MDQQQAKSTVGTAPQSGGADRGRDQAGHGQIGAGWGPTLQLPSERNRYMFPLFCIKAMHINIFTSV